MQPRSENGSTEVSLQAMCIRPYLLEDEEDHLEGWFSEEGCRR